MWTLCFHLALRVSLITTSDSPFQVEDISIRLWGYLEWIDRLKSREVCWSFNKLHGDLYPLERIKINEFHKLSKCIRSTLSNPKYLADVVEYYPHDVGLFLNNRSVLPEDDKMLIGKIIVDIIERCHSFVDAAIICKINIEKRASTHSDRHLPRCSPREHTHRMLLPGG